MQQYGRTHLPLPILTVAGTVVYQLGLDNKRNWLPALLRLGINADALEKGRGNAECCDLLTKIYSNRRGRYMYQCRSRDVRQGSPSREQARQQVERHNKRHVILCTRFLKLTAFDDVEHYAAWFEFPPLVVYRALGSTPSAAERLRNRCW